MFLPIIDVNLSDSTCIYLNLMCVSQIARQHGVTLVITFDQPLWWKALIIINSEPMGSNLKGIVLRLGDVHADMSFVGCIEHLMVSSEHQELVELIYDSNAVIYMLAICAHIIIDAAPNVLLLINVVNYVPQTAMGMKIRN